MPLATLLTEKRADLMRQITSDADVASRNLGIQVVDVRIKRIDLPEENSQAIFRRMQTSVNRKPGVSAPRATAIRGASRRTPTSSSA